MLLDDLDTLEQPCYDMKGLTRNYEFISTLSKYQNELGWGNYANDHEDANGQFESNFDYDDALVTADRAIFFRYMVHAMAQERGHLATFMPKPFAHLTGNGAHLHISLWDRPARTCSPTTTDPRGLGLSKLAYSFLGGVIDHAEAVLAIGAPTVNSYKRIGVGAAPHSGATWSPAYATYGMNNRTQAIRIPAPAASRSAPSTAPPTRTWRPRRCSAPASTASSTTPTRASRTRRTSTAVGGRGRRAASSSCPPRCSTRSGS